MKNERLEICCKCPLYEESVYGPRCNPHLYIGPNDEISFSEKDGFVKGCNCILKYKTKNLNNHCPANK